MPPKKTGPRRLEASLERALSVVPFADSVCPIAGLPQHLPPGRIERLTIPGAVLVLAASPEIPLRHVHRPARHAHGPSGAALDEGMTKRPAPPREPIEMGRLHTRLSRDPQSSKRQVVREQDKD